LCKGDQASGFGILRSMLVGLDGAAVVADRGVLTTAR